MPKLKATAGGLQIEDGEYEATLLSIEQREPTINSPNGNPFLLWTFHVLDTEEGVEMAQATSLNFGPKANARKWAQALEAREFQPDEEVELDTLCPRECRVVIAHDDKGFARIMNVLPPRRRPPVKKPATAGPPPVHTPQRTKDSGVLIDDLPDDDIPF